MQYAGADSAVVHSMHIKFTYLGNIFEMARLMGSEAGRLLVQLLQSVEFWCGPHENASRWFCKRLMEICEYWTLAQQNRHCKVNILNGAQ